MDGANQTQPQFVALSSALRTELMRVRRWAIACLVFAIAVSGLVFATRSIAFLVVAAFAWFFAWNRWKLQRLLAASLPTPNEDQDTWLEMTKLAISNAPSWHRISENFAAVAFLAVFALITIEVVPTSGKWMRLLYGAAWLFIAVRFVREAVLRRKQKLSNSSAR